MNAVANRATALVISPSSSVSEGNKMLNLRALLGCSVGMTVFFSERRSTPFYDAANHVNTDRSRLLTQSATRTHNFV